MKLSDVKTKSLQSIVVPLIVPAVLSESGEDEALKNEAGEPVSIVFHPLGYDCDAFKAEVLALQDDDAPKASSVRKARLIASAAIDWKGLDGTFSRDELANFLSEESREWLRTQLDKAVSDAGKRWILKAS